jgi:hypothetical protein
MKIIITTVGTSLFENYSHEDIKDIVKQYTGIKTQVTKLRNKAAKEYNPESGTEKHIIDQISNNWFKGVIKDTNGDWDNTPTPNDMNIYASAEIQSIIAIVEEAKCACDVYLIATDTILSRIACDLIKKWFDAYDNSNINIKFNAKLDIIEELNIDDVASFKKGLVNLNNRFYRIAGQAIENGLSKDVIINITGGYKGIIPYLTILSQVNQCPIKYIFESSKQLITIPQLPIQNNNDIFEKHFDIFTDLEKNDYLIKSQYYNFAEETEALLDIDNDYILLNYLGQALWQKYKTSFFVFYAPDDVWEEMQKQPDIMRIVSTKLSDPLVLGSSKIEIKGNHYCYDDGNNNNRIYLFIEHNMLYIYKTFQNEKAAKEYISTNFIKDIILENTKPRKIKITKI